MRIETPNIVARTERTTPRGAKPDDQTSNPGPAGMALVPLVPLTPPAGPARRAGRPDAPFLTHLIATATQAPQTRRLRRAAPADALAHYRAMTRIAMATPRSAERSRMA